MSCASPPIPWLYSIPQTSRISFLRLTASYKASPTCPCRHCRTGLPDESTTQPMLKSIIHKPGLQRAATLIWRGAAFCLSAPTIKPGLDGSASSQAIRAVRFNCITAVPHCGHDFPDWRKTSINRRTGCCGLKSSARRDDLPVWPASTAFLTEPCSTS